MALPVDDSSDLIRAARNGDPRATEALYRRYFNDALRIVRLRLGKKLRRQLESADILQSVWGDILPELERFEYRGELSFLRWLVKRIGQKIKDKAKYFASQKRAPGPEAGKDIPVRLEAVHAASPEMAPDQLILLEEDRKRIGLLVDRLPEDHREAVIMRWFEGHTYREIGRRLDRSPDAARKLVERALIRLTDALMKS